MKIGSTAYSYRKYLSSGAMSLDNFINHCYEIGLDGIELTAYYFPKTEESFLNHLKRSAFLHGLDISGVAVGNNFCLPEEGKRREQVGLVKYWIDVAFRLGAPCLRVFAGKVPEGYKEEDAFRWTVDALRECVKYAEERGIILALENHGGITETAEQVLRILKNVDSEWLRVTLDTGNYRVNFHEEIRRTAPYAVNVHAKVFESLSAEDLKREYSRILETLRQADYKGYLSIEYEGADDPLLAVPRFAGFLKGIIGRG
ncbi:sugar phosphate isomerase/epimerase [Candidatus Bathyarchaeota archaeon]|nr:sugar phosphate isomerase/epimerase [Candidatus Bathyarchaeota archaeon]MBS7627734.1 sugar phosphate isomerase/epimerase [Candidatus Bathyarchaeota archaeon]